jgi:hypothetical protein
MDWNKAIANLEQANASLIACPAEDLAGLESAMAERDRAVQDVNGLDPWMLPPKLAARLQAAFDAGAVVRTKLAGIYGDTDAELRRVGRLRRFEEPK